MPRFKNHYIINGKELISCVIFLTSQNMRENFRFQNLFQPKNRILEKKKKIFNNKICEIFLIK